MKIIVIHGPNLNLLGKRDEQKYGTITLDEINKQLNNYATTKNVELDVYQSNHEGMIIDFLQKESSRKSQGVLVNPGALIRYAYCFRQALVDLARPFIEVHMSDINKTGVNKKVNILDDLPNRIKQVTGLKEKSYYKGLEELIDYLSKK